LLLTLFVCLSQTLLLFCFSMESSHFFGRQFSMTKTTKRCSSTFDLGPLSPKICTKLPISRLVWQIDRRCLGLLRGFRGWPLQWNHAKCCGADPCCHGNEIWARRRDPVAYRLVVITCILNVLCESLFQFHSSFRYYYTENAVKPNYFCCTVKSYTVHEYGMQFKVITLCCFVITNCSEIHPMLTAKKPPAEKQNRRAGGAVAASSKSSSKSGSKSQKVDVRPKHKAVEMLKENAV